ANLLALALAQVPSPTCYGAGAAPASDCNQFIGLFCTNMAKESIRPGDNNARCYNLPNTGRCDFIALNTIGFNASPSGPNCQTVLSGVTRQCRFGGYGKITNATPANTFTVDRNAGRCSQNVQPGS
ncbi:hypothetical protein P691DRAFT_679638, partial [Macrolepiota fuliginosa MF-IS2]